MQSPSPLVLAHGDRGWALDGRPIRSAGLPSATSFCRATKCPAARCRRHGSRPRGTRFKVGDRWPPALWIKPPEAADLAFCGPVRSVYEWAAREEPGRRASREEPEDDGG